MKKLFGLLLGVMVVSLAFGQAIPPINLAGQIQPGGSVLLTWDAPPAGLVEDFNDGLAQDFLFSLGAGTYTIDGGYFKLTADATNWASGAYDPLDFDNFTLEADVMIQDAVGNSRGVFWCANGPKDADFNGYTMYFSNGYYSVWRYANNAATLITGWNLNPAILQGVGEVNHMVVDGSAGTYDLYINDTYLFSFFDATYASGKVGLVTAYSVVTWYDYITCLYTGAPNAPQQPADPGIPQAGWYDDNHQPADRPIPVADDVIIFDRFAAGQQQNSNELDEFVEYRIYRDNVLRGTSVTETYTDQLPGLGGPYSFTVTAYYDPEGESSPAGPLDITWEPAYLDLTPQNTTIPAGGGVLIYDVHVLNTLNQTFNNVNFWTKILFPNGQLFGPMMLVTVNIPAYLNTTQTLNQNIPFNAPPGTYTFYGALGFYPNDQLMDSFTFTKSPAADNIVIGRDDWSATELMIDSGSETVETLPAQFGLGEAYPNPFNPTTSFAVSLPEASDLTVTVYNIAGQKVATLANGVYNAGEQRFTFDASNLASGLYFIQATVPGKLNEIRKVTLLQ